MVSSSGEDKLRSKIASNERALHELKRRVASPKKSGYKSREEAQAKLMPSIDRLNVKRIDLKSDLRELIVSGKRERMRNVLTPTERADAERTRKIVAEARKKEARERERMRNVLTPTERADVERARKIVAEARKKEARERERMRNVLTPTERADVERTRKIVAEARKKEARAGWFKRSIPGRILRRRKKRHHGFKKSWLGRRNLNTPKDMYRASGAIVKAGGKFGSYLWRGGRSKVDYANYQARTSELKKVGRIKKSESAAEYRMQTGRWLTPGQQWWWKLFKGAFAVFAVLFLIAGFLSFTPIGKAVFGRFGVNIEPISSAALSWTTVKAAEFQSLITGVGEWKNPEVTKVTSKKGVDIKRIISTQDNFLPTDEIEIIGEGVAYALEDRETIVHFGCYINIDGNWIGHMLKEENSITVRAGRDENFAVSCKLGKYGGDFSTDVEYPKVKFVALYDDFLTKGNLKLYTMQKEELESLGAIDPFKKYNVRDNLLDSSSGTTRSSYEYGPLKLSMAVSNRQPLIEGKKYVLKINIAPDEVYWAGELKEGQFDLKVPKKIIFSTDPRSIVCTHTPPLKKSDYTFFCDFTFENVEEGLSYSRIDAQIIYDFEFSKQDTVIVAKEGVSEEELKKLEDEAAKIGKKEA